MNRKTFPPRLQRLPTGDDLEQDCGDQTGDGAPCGRPRLQARESEPGKASELPGGSKLAASRPRGSLLALRAASALPLL